VGAKEDCAVVLAEYRIDGGKAKHRSFAVRTQDHGCDEAAITPQRGLGRAFVQWQSLCRLSLCERTLNAVLSRSESRLSRPRMAKVTAIGRLSAWSRHGDVSCKVFYDSMIGRCGGK